MSDDGSAVWTSSTSTVMPIAAARVRMTAMVCGRQSSSTTKRVEVLARFARRTSVIASAAAVASSSSEAFAVGRPHRSPTMVWKFSSASRRPCEISGWYGVYAVYQDGSSSTLRRMTAGVTVPL